jgi:hypothetical protein
MLVLPSKNNPGQNKPVKSLGVNQDITGEWRYPQKKKTSLEKFNFSCGVSGKPFHMPEFQRKKS